MYIPNKLNLKRKMDMTKKPLENIWSIMGKIKKKSIDTVQINLGNRCNQSCKHCHIQASPTGTKNMDTTTAQLVIKKLSTLPVREVEFTGGTPELNPNLTLFIEKLSDQGKKLTVRTSLTVLTSPEHKKFLYLYKKHLVKVVASLPGVFPDMVDSQRGKGVFELSINALKKLNELGFGSNGLYLDLVYNPKDTELPPPQSELQNQFKSILQDRYGVKFNNLICIVNSPIGRFRKQLEKRGIVDEYLEKLKNEFNPNTIEHLMCRNQISVDYQGYVYDCDFNLAKGLKIRGVEDKPFWEIDFENFLPEIVIDDHCYACTVGRGSSCSGELIKSTTYTKVSQYYKSLSGTKDLKTSACCTVDDMPTYVKSLLPYIVDEVKNKFYGCGSPIPPAIKGCTVLDIGCGTGRDVFIASKLVGPNGKVIGVDMTKEQLDVAIKNISIQMERFGYKDSNVEFKHGYIEDLKSIGIEDNSIDVVISNCVINLSPDKKAVFKEIFRVLSPGGELYFSDVFADRRLPDNLKDDPVLLGECLAGAMYIEDFRRLLLELGIKDYRIVSSRKINISNPEIEEKIGMATFYSLTIRAFKIFDLEDRCEDYGQIAIYKGTIDGFPHNFPLDDHHNFVTNKPMLVCGNTALILSETRLYKHFEIIGDRSTHFGLFGDGNEKKLEDSMDFGSCC